jgi:hypothetical protein
MSKVDESIKNSLYTMAQIGLKPKDVQSLGEGLLCLISSEVLYTEKGKANLL